MKKKFIAIFLALIVGAILAMPIFPIKKMESDDKEIYVLQTGVFENYENALEQQKQLKDAVIIKNENEYRVLVGASKSEIGLQKIENILKEKEIPYYKKKIAIQDEKDIVTKYNLLLDKTDDADSILLLNRKILEKMAGL